MVNKFCVSVWREATPSNAADDGFFGIYDIMAACITMGCYNELEATALNSD